MRVAQKITTGGQSSALAFFQKVENFNFSISKIEIGAPKLQMDIPWIKFR